MVPDTDLDGAAKCVRLPQACGDALAQQVKDGAEVGFFREIPGRGGAVSDAFGVRCILHRRDRRAIQSVGILPKRDAVFSEQMPEKGFIRVCEFSDCPHAVAVQLLAGGFSDKEQRADRKRPNNFLKF